MGPKAIRSDKVLFFFYTPCIPSLRKAKHKSLFLGCTVQPTRGKIVSKAGKIVRDTPPFPLFGVPQKPQAKQS